MTTKPKMKGLFKGFKYISQIFEEEREDEIQIGFPTDVKHVAHIGWDGPSVDSPSWMKEFSTGQGLKSAPLGPPTGDPKAEPEIKWVSEDSSSRRNNKPTESPGRDLPDVPKSSRRHHSTDKDSSDSPRKKDSSTRPRRRNHSRDSSEGSVKSNRHHQDSNLPSDLPSPGIPDPAKKARRKKSRELAGGATRTRPRATTTCGETAGTDKDSITKNSEPQLDPIPSI